MRAWEGRVLALRRAVGAWRRWNIDAGRHSIETLAAGRLSAAQLLREVAGVDDQADARRAASSRSASWRPAIAMPAVPGRRRRRSPPTRCCRRSWRGGPTLRGDSARPRFAAGQAVRAREHQSGRAHAPAALRAGTARHDRVRSRRARVSRLQREIRGREPATPLHGALRGARAVGRGGQSCRRRLSRSLGKLPRRHPAGLSRGSAALQSRSWDVANVRKSGSGEPRSQQG